jgi:hypothetical protein
MVVAATLFRNLSSRGRFHEEKKTVKEVGDEVQRTAMYNVEFYSLNVTFFVVLMKMRE